MGRAGLPWGQNRLCSLAACGCSYAGPTTYSFRSPASLRSLEEREPGKPSICERNCPLFQINLGFARSPLPGRVLKASVSEARPHTREAPSCLASPRSPHRGTLGESFPLTSTRKGWVELGWGRLWLRARAELPLPHCATPGPQASDATQNPVGSASRGHPDPGPAAAPAHPVTLAVTSLVWVPFASVIQGGLYSWPSRGACRTPSRSLWSEAGECQAIEGWGFLAESEPGRHEPVGSGQASRPGLVNGRRELARRPSPGRTCSRSAVACSGCLRALRLSTTVPLLQAGSMERPLWTSPSSPLGLGSVGTVCPSLFLELLTPLVTGGQARWWLGAGTGSDYWPAASSPWAARHPGTSCAPEWRQG